MSKENQFLTSVANIRMFDLDTDDLIGNSKTLLNSSMTQSIQNQAIFAGKGSKKVFQFDYQKELGFSIEDAAFNIKYLALQNNAIIKNELSDYFYEEFVELDGTGLATLSKTPIATVHVELDNGNYVQVIPSANTFTYVQLANQEVRVVYAVQEMMDTMAISAEGFPKAVRLEMNVDIFEGDGTKIEEMIIDVPRFKLNGAVELGMTHDGVASFSLEGTALADRKSNYAYIKFVKIDNADIKVISLAARPSRIDLDSAVLGDSETIEVLGYRGKGYGMIKLNNSDLTWTTDDANVATVVNGIITLGTTATTGNQTVINAEYQGYTETIVVDIL